MLPIDVVVELLMLNVNYRDDDDCVDLCLSVDPLVMRTGESMNDLRSRVREYLLTLVSKPKLLSECEEGVEYLMVETPRRVYREFIYAVNVERQQRIARADKVQVIQPVEVQ